MTVRPQLVGPLTLLLGAKAEQGSPEGFTPLDRLDDFVKAYRQVLAELAERGVQWVQLDEPGLTVDRDIPTPKSPNWRVKLTPRWQPRRTAPQSW